MFGPPRRVSKRLRTTTIALAAVAAPALAGPLVASAAAATPPLQATVALQCTAPAGAGAQPFTITPSFSIYSQSTAVVSGDPLQVSESAVLTLDSTFASTVTAALPAGSSAPTLTAKAVSFAWSGTSTSTTSIAGQTPYDLDYVAGLGGTPVSIADGLSSVGSITSGTAVTASAGSITFTIAYSGASGPAQVVYTCSPTGDPTIGSWSVAAPAAPTLLDLSATSGPVGGGEQIIVTGALGGTIQGVDFGGVPATFQKLDAQQVSVTVPPLASGANPSTVAVHVTTSAGTTPDTPADRFSYYDPSDPTQVVGSFQSSCVDGNSTHLPVLVTTVVRLSTPASVNPGTALSVASTVSVQLDGAAVAQVVSQTGYTSFDSFFRADETQPSVSAMPLTITGTSQPSLTIAAGATAGGSDVLQTTKTLPISFDAPASGFGPAQDAGTLNAPAGGRVTFAGAPYTLLVHSIDANPQQYISGQQDQTYACTPTGDATVGSIKVAATAPVDQPFSFAVSGASTIKSLVKGSLPLTGSLKGTVSAAGALTGALSLNESSAKLTALGFLPVTATVDLVPTAPVTGTLTGTALAASTTVRVKIPSTSILGIKIAGGANCQAAQVSTIPLKSVGAFSATAGGTLAGTFSISNLTGCGSLNGVVSSLTSGNGNTISLTLKG